MAESSIDVESAKKRSMLKTNLPKPLTLEEKKYLLAVERGDMPNVRRMLQKAHRQSHIDIDCVDSLGRGALTVAIDGEDLEMVELLIIMGVQTKDALLHAINAEFVEAVELLLEHEELIHKDGKPYSWQTVELSTACFTPDITPLVLAAHRNNYEILKILLDRGASIPMPHDAKCGCDDCIRESTEDSLRHSLSRLNEYRALASPSLIALSSSDPILTAFQLSWELRNLAFSEPECKSEYLELRRQCQKFAVDLLHQSRSSQELAIILNHDPDNLPYQEGDHMKLARLELAITYKQKKFVAHPNIQQLLASLWYEGVPGFRRKSATAKLSIIVQTAVLFPFYCTLYMLTPHTSTGKLMRKPFMKFLIHASSYLFFLFILILVSQRAEDQLIQFFGTDSMKAERFIKQRGKPPAILEYLVLIYVIGFIYEETYEIYVEGMQSYLRNLWNFIDFTRNFLYMLVFILRVAAYIQQRNEILADSSTAYIPREQWTAFDPQLIAEGLFAGANIFSALKLVHLFSINPHLGPLQISLGRMVIDIVKFFFIYSLVLFAFACGLNQLLWYFSDLERKKCYALPNGDPDWENQGDSCLKWRSFANVFEASQSLFWASFGMVDLANFELTGIKSYTRFWGLMMFGSYSVINVIVLLNLLIAMMSNSYAMIDEHSDTEWKFARTKLWMSYFEEGNTLPPPFNIFPTMKTFLKLFRLRKKDRMKRMSTKRRNKEEKERDNVYTSVMRALVWRYISSMHKKCEEDMVTEDDINELKNDVSAFRYDILEVLNSNGMDITCVDKGDKAVLGKKMKIWERRLMKDFKVAPVGTEGEAEQIIYEPPSENEDPLSRFRRIAKLVVVNSNLNKWGQVITGACLASQIGHCSSNDSLKKQQNLLKAMKEAKKFITRSPLPPSRSASPFELPDTTGQSIVELLNEIKLPENPSIQSPDQTKVIIKTPSISLSPPTPAKCGNQKTEESLNSTNDVIPSIPEVGDFIVLDSSPATPQTLRKTEVEEEDGKSGSKSDNKISDTFDSKSVSLDKTEELTPEIIQTDDKKLQEPEQVKETSPKRAPLEKEKTNLTDDKSVSSGSSEKSSDDSGRLEETKISDAVEQKCDQEVKLLTSQIKIEKVAEPKAETVLEMPKTPEKIGKEESNLTVKKEDEVTPKLKIKQAADSKVKVVLESSSTPEKIEKEESNLTVKKECEKRDENVKLVTPELKIEQAADLEVEAVFASSSTPEKTAKGGSSLAVKKEASEPKSPMASRNITRVGFSTGRIQPKTGWL